MYLFIILFSVALNADVLVFAQKGRTQFPMSHKEMLFITETLHIAKPALNLYCEAKVREIKEERRFSDGIHIVEMLEIRYRYGGGNNVPEQKTYFPIGSQVNRSVKISKFSGTVEEIQIEADDIVNSRFIFQHNGRGEIVWMSYEDDLKTLPCVLKP